MSQPEFLKIASFANAADADHLRVVLEEHGIRAFVDGGDLHTSLSYIGSALGGVHVIVRAEDAEQSVELVRQFENDEDHPSGPPWFCGACEEVVDAGFQVCWSCGAERSEVEMPMPETAEVAFHEEENAPRERLMEVVVSDRPLDYANPFVSPQVEDQADKPKPTGEINEEAEAMLLRAWRASILGLIGLPFIASFYSMYMLVAALKVTDVFSQEGNVRFYTAFFINVVAGFVWGFCLILLISWN